MVLKKRLVKSDFNAVVAEEILLFSDVDYFRVHATTIMNQNMYDKISHVPATDFRYINSHVPQTSSDLYQKRIYCTVCKAEGNVARRSECEIKISPHSKTGLAYCNKCKLYAHSSVCFESKCQSIPGLHGKSCFEILHSESCNGMWSMVSDERVGCKRKHKVYMNLCEEYSLEDCSAKKRLKK